ncbi:hypothetical protein VFPBJ_00044 [Purpureocillium lilacinum]|uniref:Uncharacterized protein n=1 Tax=Purpureocillium lilacinum TaxID=33203 RepID=A0A179H771_PURLI|nr:hypothetical protein VFPBJ_00044 [Purpureocillium lilacinum]
MKLGQGGAPRGPHAEKRWHGDKHKDKQQSEKSAELKPFDSNLYPKVICGKWKSSSRDDFELASKRIRVFLDAEDVRRGLALKPPQKYKYDAGPDNCKRIACEKTKGNDIGLWFCNEKKESFQRKGNGLPYGALYSIQSITHGEGKLCTEEDWNKFSVQMFSKDGWSVILSAKEGLNCDD